MLKHRRISRGRMAVTCGAALAVITATVTLQSAHAQEPTRQHTVKSLSAPAAGTLGKALTTELGPAAAAGSYYDAGARALVVNVVEKKAAHSVREAGGRARVVANSLTELESAQRTLARRAGIPGTSWAMDPVANKVVVTADRMLMVRVGGRLGPGHHDRLPLPRR